MNTEPDTIDPEQPFGGDPSPNYAPPKLRRIRLAATETLTTGCKLSGDCDVLGHPNFTGGGS